MAQNPKKPPLTVINPAATSIDPSVTYIKPPRSLGEHGLALWNSVQAVYRVDDAGGIEILMQACAAADRAEALAERINRDGELVETRAGPKAHPALKAELQTRAFVVRTLERLGLNWEPIRPVGRPPGRKSIADH